MEQVVSGILAQTGASRRKGQLRALTGLRAPLALWVVLFHECLPGKALTLFVRGLPDALRSLFYTGYVAVGFFFVLSGFILAYNYALSRRWTREELRDFAIARFTRVYPVYLVGLLLTVPFRIKAAPQGLAATETFDFLLHLVLLQSWFPKFALTWNAPSWSVATEALFYLLFPICGVALWRVSVPRRLMAIGFALWLAALAAPSLLLWRGAQGFSVPADSHTYGASTLLNMIKLSPIMRLPEFLLGIVTARIFAEIKPKFAGKGFLFYLPATVCVLLFLCEAPHIPLALLHNGLLAPFYAIIILGLALGGGALCNLAGSTPMVFLGAASYTFYILHEPVALYLLHLHIRGLKEEWIYLVVLSLVSAAVHACFEEPVHKKLKVLMRGMTKSGARLTASSRPVRIVS